MSEASVRCPHTISDITGRRWKCTRPPHGDPRPLPHRNPAYGGRTFTEADRHYMRPA